MKKPNITKKKICTVAHIDGLVEALTLENNVIYELTFTPTKDGRNPSSVNKSEMEGLILGVESNYGIKLILSPLEDDDERTMYTGVNKTTIILVGWTEDQFSGELYDVHLMIADKVLLNFYNEEEQKE